VAWRQSIDEHGRSPEDIRFEMRQMSLRGERLAQGHLRAVETMSDELRANTQALRSGVDDMSDQMRANTRAALRMLDRFETGGGPASASS
jgi:hypothetical protein